jgi:hypothetical protein
VVGPVRAPAGKEGATAKPSGDAASLYKGEHRDTIVRRLDQGAVLRAANRLEDSVLAFHHASDVIYEFDQKSEVQISREVGAALTNLTYMDYKGYAYDRLALNIYQALNFLELGRIEEARTPLRAMQHAQEDAEAHFRKEIDAGEKDADAKNDKGKADKRKDEKNKPDKEKVEKSRSDPKFAQEIKSQFGDDAPIVADRSNYKLYSNPFGEYLMGLYFMAAGIDGSDSETGLVAFKRVLGMLPNNVYVQQDVALAEKVASGGRNNLPPTTYVFFETGQGPVRDQITIHIPVFIANIAWKDTGVDYVGAAFPKLKFRSGNVPFLNVQAGTENYKTEVLTDMDEVIRKDFNNELPLVITRTIIAAATKAAIQYGMNKAAEQNEYARIASGLITTAYQVAMNQADLRTWVTLPKQFQVARFATPQDRRIVIMAPNGPTPPPITLIDGVINVVYVKSVAAGQAPTIRQFKLK